MASDSLIDRACGRFAAWLLANPRLVLGGLVASVVLSLVFIPRLRFDFAPQSIYVGNDSLVAYSYEFKETFGHDESVVLIVLQAEGEGDVLDAPALQWQLRVAERLREIPGIARVESLATLEAPRPGLGGVRLERIVKTDPLDEDAAFRARGQFDNMPLLRGGLLSGDDRLATLPVFLDLDKPDIDQTKALVQQIEGVLAGEPLPTGYRSRLTGLPVLRVEIVNDLRADQWTLIPLAAITYLAVLWFMFRSVSGSLLPMVAVGIALAWTFAVFAATGESLNLVSNVLPVLLLIIGVSSSVQLVSCYSEEMQACGGDRLAAAQRAIAHMTPACLLAALTTAIGFASVATARSLVLKRFAWQAALGVGFQYLCTLLTLGTLFRFFAPPRRDPTLEGRPGPVTRVAAALGAAVARHPWPTVCGALLVVAISLWGARAVRINSYNALETFQSDHPAVQTLKLVEKELSGVVPLEVSLQADRAGRFLEPEVFHKTVEFTRQARSLPGVLAGQSYADLLREVVSHWPGRRVSESDLELVPETPAGQRRLERAAGFTEKFPEATHHYDYLSPDGTRARVRLRIAEIGSQQTLKLIGQLESALREQFPEGAGIEARLTGEAYVSALALTTLIRDLFFSLLTASLVIFSLIALEFRSLRAGLIAALPNLTPLAITMGYMGYRGYDMNVGNVIVFTVCLGLADDNTIHFLYRFRDELRRGHPVPDAIQRAFLGTGRAIVATSLLLLAGLAALRMSNFVPTQRFAELTSVTILGNLLGVLLLLPAWLKLVWPDNEPRANAATAVGDGLESGLHATQQTPTSTQTPLSVNPTASASGAKSTTVPQEKTAPTTPPAGQA